MNTDDAQVIGLTLGTAALSTLLIFPFGVAACLAARAQRLARKIAGRNARRPPARHAARRHRPDPAQSPRPPRSPRRLRAKRLRHRDRLHLESRRRRHGCHVIPFSRPHRPPRLRGNQPPARTRRPHARRQPHPRLHHHHAPACGARNVRPVRSGPSPAPSGNSAPPSLSPGISPAAPPSCPSPSMATSSSATMAMPINCSASPPSLPSSPSSSAIVFPNGVARDESSH